MMKSVKTSLILLSIVFIHLLASPALSQKIDPPPSHSGISVTQQYYQWLEMGPSAIPELKKAIQSDNWRVRTHGLLAMGKTGDPSLAPLVLDRLGNDTNPAVRNCAVMALGDLKAASAVPVLVDLLGRTQKEPQTNDLPQQRLIVQSLGKIGDSRAVLPLFSLLKSTPNEPMRAEIADALVAISDPEISRLILSLPPDAHRTFDVQAARISGALPVDGTEDFVISLTSNPSLPVKNAAIIALGNIRSGKSLPLLLSMFETDNRQIQKNIANALVSIDSPAATSPLCNLLGSPDPETATAAALVLSRMTDAQIGQQVYARFDADHRLNAPASIVLGRKKYQKAVPLLRSRLQDTGETGHDEMAEALGWMDDRESVSLLMDVAARKNKQGSAGAIWSLGHLKAGEAKPLLLKIVKQQDRQLTAPAVFALGEIGDPATVKPLIDLYYESGFQYQMQVALALSQIGGPEVAEILKTNMESGHPKRQKMAGYMLLKSSDPTLVPYAITLLDHPDETIRRYALGGLKNITGQNFDSIDEWKAWGTEQK